VAEAIYVIGGKQRAPRKLFAGDTRTWYEYERGLILRVDADTLDVEVVLDYVSPADACGGDEPQILFKSGTIVDDTLYVCTQTEVLLYSLPTFEQVGYVSLPSFNDLHHVRPTPDGNLLIANSGLDMAMIVTPGGQVVREIPTLGGDPWERFSRDVDYRLGISTKPHQSHPNYVFYNGDEPWATRFAQKDAISLEDPSRRIAIDLERVHDGFCHEGRIYFTSVDGRIAIADPEALKVEQVIDLSKLHDRNDLLGWCRSIHVDGDLAWVGFSRIRATKFRENVGWIAHGMRRVCPTHMALYDLARNECLTEVNLEGAGLSAVFSILPESGRVRMPGSLAAAADAAR
jgi:hypothetical protein